MQKQGLLELLQFAPFVPHRADFHFCIFREGIRCFLPPVSPRDSKSREDNLELGSKVIFCTWNLEEISITKDTLYDMFECFKQAHDKVSTTERGKK